MVFLVLLFIFMTVMFDKYTNLSKELAETRTHLEAYQITNGKNILREQRKNDIYENIEFDTGCPRLLILAAGIHENGRTPLSHGVRRVPETFSTYYPIQEWQGRASGRIATQVAFKMILSDPNLEKVYFEKLGVRYCPNSAKIWSEDVYKLYKKMGGGE
jgi:hypothetical protein